MKISTKGRYGLRAMVDLALNSGAGHIPLNVIAERQNVSANYMEQVFSVLRKGNLVKSVKGAQGGYVLAVHPSQIKVGDILRLLEGDLSIVEPGETDRENQVDQFLSNFLWARIDECINNVVDSITLEDLVREYSNLYRDSLMYYI